MVKAKKSRNGHTSVGVGRPSETIWCGDREEWKRQQEEFRQLLLWMIGEGKAHACKRVSEGFGPELDKLYAALEEMQRRPESWWEHTDDKYFEGRFRKGGCNPDDDSRDVPVPCIMLPAIVRHRIVPLLVVKFNFQHAAEDGDSHRCYPEVRLRVGLFYFNAKGNLRGIGYRLEVPEGPPKMRHPDDAFDLAAADDEEEQVTHDFVHIQHVDAFRKGDSPFPGLEGFDLPKVAPAWPLIASEPTSLLVALWIGLYGKASLDWITDPEIREMFARCVVRMARTPHGVFYELVNVDTSKWGELERVIVRTWPEQKDLVSGVIRQRYNADSRVEVLREVDASTFVSARARKMMSVEEVFWKLRLRLP